MIATVSIARRPSVHCVLALCAAATPCFGQGQPIGWGRQAEGQVPNLTVPSLLRFTQIDAGPFNTAMIRSDSTMMVIGANNMGQLSVPSNLGAVKQISTGYSFFAALRPDGTVRCWGQNFDGECNVPPGLSQVVHVSAGNGHVAAIKANGTVVCWGRNDVGQCNVPEGLAGVVTGDVGELFTLAVRADGTVAAWGDNSAGQCDPPPQTTNVVEVSGGFLHAVALRGDGSVVAWGQDNAGECGYINGRTGVRQVVAGRYNSYALLNDGSVITTTGPYYGSAIPMSGNVVAISDPNNGSAITALMADGTMKCWPDDCQLPERIDGITQVAAGSYGSLGLLVDGTIRAWGSIEPPPAGLRGVVQIAAGPDFGLALKSDGTVACWKSPWFEWGQCSVPDGLSGVVEVDCGGRWSGPWEGAHAVARKSDGTVVCWGWNEYDQCDPPKGLSAVVDVSAGGFHSLALRSDGTVAAWGAGDFEPTSPVEHPHLGQSWVPADVSGVIQVEAGGAHSVVLRADGTVRCWGEPAPGTGSGCYGTPDDLAGVVAISAGFSHTVALRSDGRVVAWGSYASVAAEPPAWVAQVTQISTGGLHTLALMSPEATSCSNPGGAGTATLTISGAAWDNLGIWSWSNGGSAQIPGALSAVDLGAYGSVGSTCDAQCATLVARSGSTLLMPIDLSNPSTWDDHSITVSGTATMAGRVWLLATGASQLPANLNVPVLTTGDPKGTFDVIQTTVPPPAGKFLTLVPSDSLGGGTTYSLRLLDLPGTAALTNGSAGSFAGEAVAAETMDWNGDGFDDLALAVSFGSAIPGKLQVLVNDGQGNIGGTSVQVDTPPLPQCLGVGDVDEDGRVDAVVCTGSDQSGRIYLNSFSGSGQGVPFVAGVTLQVGGNPTSAVVIPSTTGSSLKGGGPAGAGVGVATSGSGGSGGGAPGVKVFNGSTGAVVQSVPTQGYPNSVVRRGRQLATGGSSATTVDGGDFPGFLAILTPDAQGSYAVTQSLQVPGVPRQMDVADIDGDGYADIVSANSSPELRGAGTPLPVLTLFRGRTDSLGQAVPIAPDGASSGIDITLIDVDGDGDRDLVSVHQTLVGRSEAVLLQIDTPGPGRPLTIGQQKRIEGAEAPLFCSRGNLDGVGGEDLFLVDESVEGSTLASDGGSAVRPYLGELSTPCLADINRDGQRDGTDLAMLLAQWGVSGSADINSDGVVAGEDLAYLLANWGPCP